MQNKQDTALIDKLADEVLGVVWTNLQRKHLTLAGDDSVEYHFLMSRIFARCATKSLTAAEVHIDVDKAKNEARS